MTTFTDIASRPTISVPEAGQVLGIGRDAAYAAAARNEIPTLRLGRALRVPVPRLLELLGFSPANDEAPQQPQPERLTMIKSDATNQGQSIGPPAA
jgi:excisionase family DNA binding protein